MDDKEIKRRMDEDTRSWGFIERGKFIELPKAPILRADIGVDGPPFDVTLPEGEVRHVIYKPE